MGAIVEAGHTLFCQGSSMGAALTDGVSQLSLGRTVPGIAEHFSIPDLQPPNARSIS